MNDSKDFILKIKTLIVNTMKSQDLADYIYGEVIQVSPLKIKIDQKIILEEMQIDLARNVTEWVENIEINWTTSDNTHNHPFTGDGSVQDSTHNHKLEGTYQVKHKTALQQGEKVALIQKQGGQRYLVVDRV